MKIDTSVILSIMISILIVVTVVNNLKATETQATVKTNHTDIEHNQSVILEKQDVIQSTHDVIVRELQKINERLDDIEKERITNTTSIVLT